MKENYYVECFGLLKRASHRIVGRITRVSSTVLRSLGLALLLLSGFTASAFDFEVDGFYFNILSEDDLTIEVTSGTTKYTGDIVIPTQVTYNSKNYNVTAIGSSAFKNCVGIKTVSIPSSVAIIKGSAFWGCTGMTSVLLSEGLTTMGISVFQGCEKLTTINLPASLTDLRIDIFDQCTNLESIKVASGNSKYASFNGIVYLKGLKTLYKCPEGFKGELIMPDCVTEIVANACIACSGLTSVNFPEGLTKIGKWAFAQCDNLKTVLLPASITELGESPFNTCTNLESINVAEGCANYTSIDGIVYNNDITSVITCPPGKKGEVIVPSSVTMIGDYAFDGCEGLTSILLPSSVSSIGFEGFASCTGLTSVFIPSSVKTIGSDAFIACYNLKSVNIPDGVVSLNDTFTYASKLTDVWCHIENPFECNPGFNNDVLQTATLYVPEGTKSAYQGVAPWNSFANIVEVGYGDNSFNINGIYYKIISDNDKTVEVTSGDNKYIGDFEIPSEVYFDTKTYKVTKIGDNAFARCFDLTSVSVPNTVSEIGSFAFLECYALTTINLPENLNSIGHFAFQNCSGLKSVSIPASVNSIGIGAFYDCNAIEAFDIAENNEIFASKDGIIYSKDFKTVISCPAGFKGDVIIPSTVTSIGSYAFGCCRGISSVTIPSSVTSIGASAFDGCSGLTMLSLPSSLISIGGNAFISCNTLKSIYNNSEEPLECDKLFSDETMTSATLYIPKGTKAAYQQVAPWKNFSNIEEKLAEGESVTVGELKYAIISETEGTAKVVSLDKNYSGEIVIPTDVDIQGKTYTVTEIGASAFAECEELTGVTIPSTVTTIGRMAFMNCVKLESMSIPASVVTIGNFAFQLCSSLQGFILAEENPAFAAADGILYDKNIETLICCPMTKVGEVVIPSTVTTIKDNSFAGCVEMTSVVIPSSVTTIEYSAFNTCVSLSTVSIPASVTSIGDDAFAYCENLKSVHCNWDEPLACNELFHESALLNATLYVPKGTVEKYQAVEPWRGFAKIEETASNGDRLLADGIYYVIMSDEDCTVAVTYGENPYTGELVIPSTVEIQGKTYDVTTIDYMAFCLSPELTAVSIPASVNTVCPSALAGATALETIAIAEDNQTYTSSDNVIYSKDMTTLVLCPPSRKGEFVVPTSVTVIGFCAFDGCKELTSVTLSDNVTRIENLAFSNCSGLTNMIIPAGVSYIGNVSFYANTSLESFDVSGLNETYTGLDGMIYTADMASLVACPAGKTGVVNIPSSVTSIGANAFSVCREISGISIPESVELIEMYAFEMCESLTTIDIPASVKLIGTGAFNGCLSLKSVRCNWNEPLVCESTFYNELLAESTLYVPKGTTDKYKAVEPWKNFGHIEEMVSTSVDDIYGADGVSITIEDGAIRVRGLDGDAVVTVYDYAGRIVYTGKDNFISNLSAGLYIVRVGSETVKVSI